MTQAELAERLGVNRTTVLDMEAGRNPALTRWMFALSLLNYDIVVVPRGSKVAVTERVDDQSGAAGTASASAAR